MEDVTDVPVCSSCPASGLTGSLTCGRRLKDSGVAAVHTVPPAISMKGARDEAEMVLYDCVAEALARSRLKPRQVCAIA